MANTLFDGLKEYSTLTRTENGATTRITTFFKVLDMFAMGGACRNRDENSIITMFQEAFEEDSIYALKCLFYLRDVRGGQGERRFFKICIKHLANTCPEAVIRNIELIPYYGRWDDLFVLFDTPVEDEMLALIKRQIKLDAQSKTPSLLAKWMPSENTSSAATRATARRVRSYLGVTPKLYRKVLSELRSRINIVEKLMSENRWSEIEFDKIPSKAGIKYKNAFAKHDVDNRYAAFMQSKSTKVNADVLNPVDIVSKVYRLRSINQLDVDVYEKYWNNLKDYYNGKEENAICICDVSGSMYGLPMEAAIAMSMYIAERGKGPFANHFLTFSESPKFIEIKGENVVKKIQNISKADWGYNTNIEKVFDLLLNIATQNNIAPEDMVSRLYIFSDMEFDQGLNLDDMSQCDTLIESIAKKWEKVGYELPHIIFWNLDSRHNNIPAMNGRYSYISGFNMNMVESVLSGKTGIDLMLEKLNSDRYAPIK